MSLTILEGHVLDRLRGMEAESVQCCVTSTPYWSLRDYKTTPQVWGGETGCAHEWGQEMKGGEGFTGKSRWQHKDHIGRHAVGQGRSGRNRSCPPQQARRVDHPRPAIWARPFCNISAEAG